MPSGLQIARIFGIRIMLHPSWFLVMIYLTWTLFLHLQAEPLPPMTTSWMLGSSVLVGLLFFFSILLHELGHSLVALHHGLPVRQINLFLFGGVAIMERDPETPLQELKIAIAGPLVSAVLAAAFHTLDFDAATRPLLHWGTSLLAVMNFMVAVFNLLPGYPLDGGRVLRAILWWKTGSRIRATRSAGLSGQIMGYLFIGLGILELWLQRGQTSGAWLILLGWFLFVAAQGAVRQVELDEAVHNLVAGDLLSTRMLFLDTKASLQHVAQELITRGERWAFVLDEGNLSGLITLSDLRQVPPASWPELTAQMVATPIGSLTTATPEIPVSELLATMIQENISQIPILSEQKTVGVVSLLDIIDRTENIPSSS